jgi:hypothetical protein
MLNYLKTIPHAQNLLDNNKMNLHLLQLHLAFFLINMSPKVTRPLSTICKRNQQHVKTDLPNSLSAAAYSFNVLQAVKELLATENTELQLKV